MLISLGILGIAGSKFSDDVTTIKVTKGAIIVIKRLWHKSKLYKMIGSTVKGDASIGTVKKPKSILKKSVPTKKFKESSDFIQVLKSRKQHTASGGGRKGEKR